MGSTDASTAGAAPAAAVWSGGGCGGSGGVSPVFSRVVDLARRDHVEELERSCRHFRAALCELGARYDALQREHAGVLGERGEFERRLREALEGHYGDRHAAMRAELARLKALIPKPRETADAAAETEELESDFRARAQQQRDRHEAALKELQAAHEAQLHEQARGFDDELRAQREVWDAARGSEVGVLESRLKSEAAQRAAERQQLEGTVASLRDALAEAQRISESQSAMMSRAREEADARYSGLRRSYDELLHNFREAEQAANDHMARHRDELKRAREEACEVTRSTERKWRALVASESERCEALDRELQDVRGEQTALMSRHHAELRGLEEKLAAAQVQLTKALEENRRADDARRVAEQRVMELEKTAKMQAGQAGRLLATQSEEREKQARVAAEASEEAQALRRRNAELDATCAELRRRVASAAAAAAAAVVAPAPATTSVSTMTELVERVGTNYATALDAAVTAPPLPRRQRALNHEIPSGTEAGSVTSTAADHRAAASAAEAEAMVAEGAAGAAAAAGRGRGRVEEEGDLPPMLRHQLAWKRHAAAHSSSSSSSDSAGPMGSAARKSVAAAAAAQMEEVETEAASSPTQRQVAAVLGFYRRRHQSLAPDEGLRSSAAAAV